MSAQPVHHFAPHPGLASPTEAGGAVVPFGRAPQNQAELDALLGERMRQDSEARRAADAHEAMAATPVAPPPLAPVKPAMPLAALAEAQEARRRAEAPPATVAASKPVTAPQSEAEARSRLAEAIGIRDEARRALAHVEDAVAKAKAVEAEAEARAAASVTTEMRGGDDLARRILEWSISGGARPDLAPDAESLEARREQDLARVHADAARQAARALDVDLIAKRAVAEQAERAVTYLAGEVVSAMVEAVAIKGAEAQRIFERARMASRVVFDLGAGRGVARTIRAQPTMQRLCRGGEIGLTFSETAESGPRQEHLAAWSGLLAALQTDPNAALG